MKVLYHAKNYSGEARTGELDVKNERDLAAQLRSDGFMLTSFEELEVKKETEISVQFLDRFFGISLKDKLMFTRNLSVMISSGLPISRAVKNIATQTKNKKFKKILEAIFDDIQAGMTFADGLAKYPAIFDELFVNMVRVGEASGNLEEILEILAIQLEKEHDLVSKLKGALTYPAVIIVAMIAIAILMLTFILPKMMSVFQDMNVSLPASTQFMIKLSDLLRNHAVFSLIALVLGGIFLKFFLTTKNGKKTLAFILINIPVINNLVIKNNCARFARIYSSLLRSGVPVVQALTIISNTLTNYYYKDALKESVDEVQKGVTLSKIVEKHPKIFPLLMVQMIQVGEETGKTESVLLKLAEFYEGEISQISKNMSSIIEPVLMIFIGTAVGFFAISMLQPMYSLMDNIK
ncbi:MAG: type II secretion system F family protein [Candidatus Moraniibacteriota bacterium]|jgi:type IV pilus assembly protein PilC